MAALALGAILPLAQADEFLHYTFEDLTSPLAEGGPVANTAGDSLGDGTIFGSVNMALTTGNAVSLGGMRYDLGQSLQLFAPDGDSGLGASGVNSQVLLYSFGVGGDQDYTAMAWANFANQNGDNMIFGGDPGNVLHLGARGTQYHSGHWADDVAGGTTVPNEWHHVAYTNAAATGTQTIFVDGVQVAQGAAGNNADPVNVNLLIGSSLNGGSYVGQLDEIRVYDQLFDGATIATLAVDTLPVIQLPAISGATFTDRDEVTITLEDFGSTSVVDELTLGLEIDMVAAPTTDFTVMKAGSTTTIVYTFPGGDPPPYTQFEFNVTGTTTAATGSEPFAESRLLRSNALPAVLRAGLAAAPNGTWDLIEFQNVDFPASVPQTIAADEQGYRDVLEVVANGTITEQEIYPVLNHNDPENPGGGGEFCPDIPIASNGAGDDNNFILFGRTELTIAAGEEGTYTMHVAGDDGYALRVSGGAMFTSIAGTLGNQLDANDPATALFPGGTGNSNAFITTVFPTPGNYLIEFVGYEIGGGAFQELSIAPGTHTAISSTIEWELIGDHASQVPSFVSKFNIAEGIIPSVLPEGGWSTHIWYGAMRDNGGVAAGIGGLADLVDFLNDIDSGAAAATFSAEFEGSLATLNHSDSGGNAGIINPTEAFPNQPNPGAEDNIAMIAVGRIVIPEDGLYTFQVRSDDGFLFRFLDNADDFVSVDAPAPGTIAVSGYSEFFFPNGTGDSNSRAVADLTAGEHDVLFAWWEGAGGSHFEVSAASGAFAASNGLFRLVGDETPPNGPTVVGLGVTQPGWTVTHIGPNLDPPVSDGGAGIGVGTFAFSLNDRLDAAEGNPANTSMHPEVNFSDNGVSYGIPVAIPWPGDTPGDDNQYAQRGTATLDIQTAGDYYLGFQSDDGAYLDVVGQDWTMIVENVTGAGLLAERDPTNNPGVFDRMITEVGTGNSRTIGLINLDVGQYELEFAHYEAGGGSYVAVIGTDAASYMTGATLLPIGTDRAGTTFTPPTGLRLVGSVNAFRITGVSYEPTFGELTLAFDSVLGTDYAIDLSTNLINWITATTVSGLDGTTQATLDGGDIDGALGAGPHAEVYARVRIGPPIP